ncbi:MAG: hypothetical protein RMJ15_08115 [Nitrososphaerota archaeon]|nr:hypothetical protein [Candidatus Bathyarchaeota archaeon]MDW8023682.1 hypothetical protein [Nitrososphaerota archaeon]
MANREKIQKIEELNRKLFSLREQKSKVEAEARELAEKRNKLNEAFKNLLAEIFETRKTRDQINMEIKELKKQREETRKDKAQKIEELKVLRQEIMELEKKRPNKSLQKLKGEIEGLEWEIQTTPLSLQDEKKLVERVKQLEIQLNVCRKIEQLAQKSLELKAEIKAMQARIKFYSEEISEKARKSQEFHEKMLEKIKEAEKLKVEADNLHMLFLQAKERIKPFQSEIEKVSGEITQLRMEILAEEKKARKKVEEELLANMEKQAREKLKRGEKLTWEEFKVLAEKGTTQN